MFDVNPQPRNGPGAPAGGRSPDKWVEAVTRGISSSPARSRAFRGAFAGAIGYAASKAGTKVLRPRDMHCDLRRTRRRRSKARQHGATSAPKAKDREERVFTMPFHHGTRRRRASLTSST